MRCLQHLRRQTHHYKLSVSHNLISLYFFVLGLRNRVTCLNYEVVQGGIGPLLLQPGSNLRQGTTHPQTLGSQPASFKPDETNWHANDERQVMRIQQTTSEGQTRGAPILNKMRTFSCLVCGTRDLVLFKTQLSEIGGQKSQKNLQNFFPSKIQSEALLGFFNR